MRRPLQKILRYLGSELFHLFLLPFDLIIPKRNDYWIFTLKGNRPWADSMRSVFENVLKEGNITPIILVNGSDRENDVAALYEHKIRIFPRMSFWGVWYFLRSNVCLISYSNADLYSIMIPHFRHLVVHIPHGINMKATNYAAASRRHIQWKFLSPYYINCDVYFASSDIDRLAISAAKGHSPHKIIPTGLPRNDLMFNETPLPNDLQQEENRLEKAIGNRKLVLYAMTWRDWDDDINPLAQKENLASLAAEIGRHGGVLGLTHHPLYKPLPMDGVPNVIDCGQKIYSNPQILLRNTDILISDYSSIWIDYLLKDKPVIGFCYDYERFLKDRSFLYDFGTVFPGEITYRVPELITAVGQTLSGNEPSEFKSKREFSRKIFFKYTDNQSTQRVMDKIKEHLS